MPDGLEYLWRWFHDLHRGRTVTGMGYTRSTHQDMMAWMALFAVSPQPWELRALQHLGIVWMNVMNEETATVARPHG